MYDTIDFNLKSEFAGNIDLLAEVPLRLENSVEIKHINSNRVTVTGYIDSIKVNVTENRVKIIECSLPKWFLGDNFQTLTRGNTKEAIGKMSDLLHLPIHKADINRIDIAQNFIVKHETDVYYNHLGLLPDFNRLEQNKGIYYNNNNNKILVFYDKIADYKHKNLHIPEMYQNRNVLRYEIRFKKQLLKVFNLPQLRAELLYNEQFYIDIINKWHEAYKNIHKIRNSNNIDYTMIKTKEQLKTQGLLLLIQEQGGELEFYKNIAEAQKKAELTNKQAYDLRNLIKDASKSNLLTCESDVITELDKKVKEAIKFYR